MPYMKWWPTRRRDSVESNITLYTDMEYRGSLDDEDDDIMKAIERAKAFKLCLRRIWAVSASLPGREKSLPRLIPASGMFPAPSHNRQHHEHDQCTFDFCEHSRIDFTSVAQHHERCVGDCGSYKFPLDQLIDRAERGSLTAWKLVSGSSDDALSLLDSSLPYMAVSHVWADGTGAGIWGPGRVNKCLYKFFCGIAREFQCEGCWWDTISIPQDDEARSKALNTMHNNYSGARITLVHDLYLREWEWVDAETACFAIVMSPWYSRGWTALELAKSHKVKIIFKARNDSYLIKDLDVDILNEIPSSSSHHPAAEAIRKLRVAGLHSFGDLLSILGPRDTSKPRDIPIVSGLLAGVEISGGLSQQEIYQRILRKLGKVAHGHLFHDSATMAAPGFSWCPTNILDMPMANTDSESVLELQENGDLEGTWKAHSTGSLKDDDFIWHRTHPLTHASLRCALDDENKHKHILLTEPGPPSVRALLVRPMKCEEEPTTNVIYCCFVGPVYLRSALGSVKDGDNGKSLKIRISNTEKMYRVREKAWTYVCEAIKKHEAVEAVEMNSINSNSAPGEIFDEDGSSWQDMEALLFLESNLAKAQFLFADTSKVQRNNSGSNTSDDMSMFYVPGDDNNSLTSIQAFFYGHEGLIDHVKTWLEGTTAETGKMMLLFFDKNAKIQADSNASGRKAQLGGRALQVAVEKGQDGVFGPLVTVLLDSGAMYVPNDKGQFPIETAIRNGDAATVKRLLTNRATAFNPLVQLIAEGDSTTEYLVETVQKQRLNSQGKRGKTALIVAAMTGQSEITQLLLDKGARADLSDDTGYIALHYAAQHGHDECVRALLEHTKLESQEHTGAQDHQRLARKTNLDAQNAEQQTALHLASSTNKSKVLEMLLAHGANTTIRDSQNQTALILAAQYGNVEAVETLLPRQSGIGDQRQKELDVALLSAAAKLAGEDKEAVSLKQVIDKLVDCQARVGCEDSDGMTALHCAIKAKEEGTANRLIGFMENCDENLDKKDNRKQQSALLMAVCFGLNATVNALLQRGADIKSQDATKKTILHWAAIKRNVNLAQEILKMFTDQVKSILDEPDTQGRTALHLAASSGEARLTQLLLDANAKSFVPDKDKQSALILAVKSRRVDVVKILAGRCDITACDISQKSALDWAAIKGFNDVVVELLNNSKMPEDEMYDKLKGNALKLAAKEGHLLVSITLYEKITDLKLQDSSVAAILFCAARAANIHEPLIEKIMKIKIDPNYQDENGSTALMLAVLSQGPLFNMLLALKADPNIQDNKKRTALMMAAEKNYEKSVKSLLFANANPNIRDEQGYTALHYAIKHTHQHIVSTLRSSLYQTRGMNIPDNHRKTKLHLEIEQLMTTGRLMDLIPWIKYQNVILYDLLQAGARPDIQDEEGQTPLHLAIANNRSDVAPMLLDKPRNNTVNLDIPDNEGCTPLLLATQKGDIHMLRTLLMYNFNPDTQDKHGRTPLLLAAEGGDERSVRELLGMNANPNLADRKSRTPLLQAAQNGHHLIVNHLIQGRRNEETGTYTRNKSEKANLDARDNMGRTALMLAAENGNDEIITILQSKGANSSLIDYEGQNAWQKAMHKGHANVVGSLLSRLDVPTQDMTAVNEALLLAARRGWIELVKVLLRQRADVTFQSKGGWTALHMAAMGGHHDVVKSLLEEDKGRGVVAKDKKGRTALVQATEQGFESIVRLLIDRPEVSNDIAGWMGSEALLCAAETGNSGIVDLLLRTNVKLDNVDSAERTAMILAAINGNPEIVSSLLRQGADPKIKDGQGRAALHHAAGGGHDNIVKSLLDYEADINASDCGKQTALHLAAERASTSVVRLLLAKGANANAKAKDDQTPLHRAAWGGSCDVVKLLRKSGADPFVRDCSDNKPWQVAAEKGYEIIVETLLDEEESVQDELIFQKKGLIFASQKGYRAMATALLNKGAEGMVKDQDGLTPLHWAAKRGDDAMVDLLIQREGPIGIINSQDNQQRTPLCLAVLEGRATVVRMLLDKGADPNITSEKRQTVLHIAAAKGNGEIVQILDDHKADPHARDDQGQKAWLLAANCGYHQIVRLLLIREVDFNPQSQKIEELFLDMAEKGLVRMVELLLLNGVDKDVTDRLGRVAIGLAAEKQHHDVVELLLKAGANLAFADSSRQTPLLWAAKTGNTRIMKLLLESITTSTKPSSDQPPLQAPDDTSDNTRSNEDVQALDISNILNHTDLRGQTALLIAVDHNHHEVVKLLLHKDLAKSIKPDFKDAAGRTALHLAADMECDHTMVDLLLKAKPDQRLRDTLGRTALFLAVERNKYTVVETLLESSNKTDFVNMTEIVNMVDLRQRTALQVAAERGYSIVVKKLLEKNANPDEQDNLKRTALLLAAENGEKEVVDLLLGDGARQDLADHKGRTPLLLAVANGDKAIVETLLGHRKTDISDTDALSLLHLARQSGNKEVAWLITERIAPPPTT